MQSHLWTLLAGGERILSPAPDYPIMTIEPSEWNYLHVCGQAKRGSDLFTTLDPETPVEVYLMGKWT